MYKLIRYMRVPVVTLVGLYMQYSYWHDYKNMQHASDTLSWIVAVSAIITIAYIISQLTRDCSSTDNEIND